ncbi:uncharacterized protein LOC132058429 [Lycium ferocissimum]|uniref:uncharacterized protein LOC132058429 n=1 Tax=Lycium ferocissimum TaxID=112874 RepID=UPI0028160FFB|nr:uncharacterized protein LOC132058429 [Lycium ferocissimum]
MSEDSGESGCNSKTSSNFGQTEDEAEKALSKLKEGGSSSDSTVEESEKKPCVRPYVRSKMPRLRWTPDLHLRFVHAVERLGGQDRATPKLVLQMMNIKGLNIAHVKSHLQMYRSKKLDDQGQGISHHHNRFMEGEDQNIFNLSQFPVFPTSHQRLNSPFRYEDASWNCHGNWIPNTTVGQSILNRTRGGFYPTLNQDLCTGIPSFISERSALQTNEVKDEIGLSRGKPRDELTRLFHIVAKAQARAVGGNGNTSPPDLERTINLEKQTPLKRKASDCDLDLNLCLGAKPRINEEIINHDDNDNGSSLSLSLSSPLSSSRVTRFMEDANIDATTGFTQRAVRIGCESHPTLVWGGDSNIEATTENARKRASTLDLTL